MTPLDLAERIDRLFAQYAHDRPPLIGTPESEQQLLRDCQQALIEADQRIRTLETELNNLKGGQ